MSNHQIWETGGGTDFSLSGSLSGTKNRQAKACPTWGLAAQIARVNVVLPGEVGEIIELGLNFLHACLEDWKGRRR